MCISIFTAKDLKEAPKQVHSCVSSKAFLLVPDMFIIFRSMRFSAIYHIRRNCQHNPSAPLMLEILIYIRVAVVETLILIMLNQFQGTWKYINTSYYNMGTEKAVEINFVGRHVNVYAYISKMDTVAVGNTKMKVNIHQSTCRFAPNNRLQQEKG